MVRGIFYLIASGIVWMVEGFIFSRFLQFSAWQTALMALLYACLFAAAAAWLFRLASAAPPSESSLPVWRYISVAPMLTAIVGSFVSLPLVLLIIALGKM